MALRDCVDAIAAPQQVYGVPLGCHRSKSPLAASDRLQRHKTDTLANYPRGSDLSLQGHLAAVGSCQNRDRALAKLPSIAASAARDRADFATVSLIEVRDLETFLISAGWRLSDQFVDPRGSTDRDCRLSHGLSALDGPLLQSQSDERSGGAVTPAGIGRRHRQDGNAEKAGIEPSPHRSGHFVRAVVRCCLGRGARPISPGRRSRPRPRFHRSIRKRLIVANFPDCAAVLRRSGSTATA